MNGTGARSAGRRRLPQARRLRNTVVGCLARARGNGERRLELAETLGYLAWLVHDGSFVVPAAEAALRDDGDLVGRCGLPRDATALRGRTLHVATEIYAVGGHTRLVGKWIGLLGDEKHAVVLVRQRSPYEPSWLIPEGADVPLIDLEQSGVLERRDKVARLIELFQAARRVVLHIHPNDACAVAAAYRVPGADIRFVNHADHVGWLGAGLPATFLNLRQRGTRLAARRRAIDASACDVVPLPIRPPPLIDRHAAREQLGIANREILLLTIASGPKYTPVDGRSLAPVLDALLAEADVRLMAIGPQPGHPLFAALSERHPGQVFVPGPIIDPAVHRAAADVYLDSYPFCSPTSLLESAAAGTPVVAFQPDPEELEILYAECPWLSREAYTAPDPRGLVDLVQTLARDAGRRREVSAALLAGMTKHFPEAWRQAMKAHLARQFAHPPWDGRGLKARNGALDVILAGLGHDAHQLGAEPAQLGLDERGLKEIRAKRLFRLL